METQIGIMMSNRHAHLSRTLCDTLFGEGYALTVQKEIGAGEFAAAETVTIVGPKGQLEEVRVMGPARDFTQVELLQSDCHKLGVDAPLRDSGDLEGAVSLQIVGPNGSGEAACGIVAHRHIHMADVISEPLGIADRQMVNVRVGGERGITFHNVLVRVHKGKRALMHIDIEEGNAAGIKNGDMGELLL